MGPETPTLEMDLECCLGVLWSGGNVLTLCLEPTKVQTGVQRGVGE